MHPDLLNYLACPKCGGELRVTRGALDNGHVEEGELACQGCPARYAVRNGIPRMIAALNGESARGADDRVDLTVSQYSAYQGEVYAPMAESLQNEAILKARTGLDAWDYKDKVCLDAGCGIGRFSRVMARAGARRVIALDAGDSIDAAKKLTDPALPRNAERPVPPTGTGRWLVRGSSGGLVAVPAIEVAVLVAVRDVEVAVVAGGRRDGAFLGDLRADLRIRGRGRGGAGEADREGDRGGERGEGLHGGLSCPKGLIQSRRPFSSPHLTRIMPEAPRPRSEAVHLRFMNRITGPHAG